MAAPALPHLPAVKQLAPTVTRILGCNPGHYTLQGTNTYLIGSQGSYCLFDAGEGVPEFATLLEEVLKNAGSSVKVEDIVLSHWHHDHVDGLPDVLRLLAKLGCPRPRLWKWPCAEQDDDIASKLSDVQHLFAKSAEVHGLFELQEMTKLAALSGGEFIHVPGHTTDSIALKLPKEQFLLTADTILGHGTAVFENLKTYMTSLEKLDGASKGCKLILPGHGEVLSPSNIRMYIDHRLQRENQVVEKLRAAGSGGLSPHEIMMAIYDGQIPDKLKPAATHGVMQHLDKLLQEGRAEAFEDDSNQQKWVLSASTARNPISSNM